MLKVNIHDKLSKIQEVLDDEGIQGFLTMGGKLLESPADTTFAKQFIKNNTKFALISTESCAKPIIWVRFPEFYYTDYFYMNTRYWDAVCFIPRRNITFFGWGLFSNYNKCDVTIKLQWQIGDGEKSEEYEM